MLSTATADRDALDALKIRANLEELNKQLTARGGQPVEMPGYNHTPPLKLALLNRALLAAYDRLAALPK
jgi:hypothetical protein